MNYLQKIDNELKLIKELIDLCCSYIADTPNTVEAKHATMELSRLNSELVRLEHDK